MKFTDQAISKLKPTDKQVDYRDDITKGLILRIGKSGKKAGKLGIVQTENSTAKVLAIFHMFR